jgi:hypothetical protein
MTPAQAIVFALEAKIARDDAHFPLSQQIDAITKELTEESKPNGRIMKREKLTLCEKYIEIDFRQPVLFFLDLNLNALFEDKACQKPLYFYSKARRCCPNCVAIARECYERSKNG